MATPLNNSVLKAFEILSLINVAHPEISSAILVERLGLNNATAHRFLMTLEAAGALRATKRGYFALGPKIDELGQVSEETGAIGILLQPELEAVSRALNESVLASKLAKNGPTCVAVAKAMRAISVNIRVGTVLPFHTSAQGKLWLAEMSKDRRKPYLENAAIAGSPFKEAELERLHTELGHVAKLGFATNLGENEPDIAAVSVPVRKTDGTIALSLSAFGLLGRFDKRFIETAKIKLGTAAERVGKLLS